ncbi:antA/AntB antirepressor family protein [Marinomonas ostreistagni]|nr:antA/AntB antirepressor family protein [Marinomonas ostreistagni]
MAMELITLHICVLNECSAETVNARDLHEFLEIGRDFATWLKARISQYDFFEGEDEQMYFCTI